VGQLLGRAYQIADDLLDGVGDPRLAGKVGRRDAELGRPSAVRALGPGRARELAEATLREAVASIPPGRAADPVRSCVRSVADRFARQGLLRPLPRP
jgi:geranylgeranyl diphosphate synthase type II